MDKPKKTPKQIRPDIEPEGKYQEALKSPLYHLKSKGKVMKEIKEKSENTQGE